MNIEEQYFTCKECGESKLWGEFMKDKTCYDGIFKMCHKCLYSKYGKKVVDMTPEQRAKKKEANKKYRENNQKLKERKKQYYQNNSERLRKERKKWRYANIDKVRAQERERKRHTYGERVQYQNAYRQRSIKYLTPQYVKYRLREKGFTREQINQNPELINIQRIIIQTKRLCKT